MPLKFTTIAAGLLAFLCGLPGAAVALESYSLKMSDQVIGPPQGGCNHSSQEFNWGGPSKTTQSVRLSLPQGTYRPVLNGTRWLFTKESELSSFDTYWGGDVTIEVVRVEIFGAEAVVSRFSRGQESRGRPEVYDEEFNTFTVTAAEVGANAQYRLRTTVHTLPCSRTALRDIRVDLIKEK